MTMTSSKEEEEEEEEEAADWENLPYDIVELIMKNLMTPDISDRIRCSVVCTSWRTVYYDHSLPIPRLPPPPFLIVPTQQQPCSSNKSKRKKKKKKKINNTKSLGFYNVIHKRVYNQFQVTIPSNRYFRGSSYSWLVAVDQDNDCQVRLFNPFLSPSLNYTTNTFLYKNKNNEIPLPSLKHLIPILIDQEHNDIDDDDYSICTHHNSPTSYAYLRKAVLSWDPLSHPTGSCIVMAIFGQRSRLAYCNTPADKTWTLVDHKTASPEFSTNFNDVICYKDRFFAIHYYGTVIVLDPDQNMAITVQILSQNQFRGLPCDKLYLTIIQGAIFAIHREVEVGDEDMIIKRKPYSTDRVRVFTLMNTTKNKYCDIEKLITHQKGEEENGKLQWMVTKDLWGNTLFLGDNTTMSIHASDYPGCKPNSIYYTDDYIGMYHCKPWNGPHDLGVFNLEDETIENHYPTNHDTPIWPIPIWIEPLEQASDLHQNKEWS